MPWKLIITLIVLVLVAIFSGFNLTPVSISVGFHIFENVPLFLALIIAFILGSLFMVPFTMRGLQKTRRAVKEKTEAKYTVQEMDAVPVEEETGAQKKRK